MTKILFWIQEGLIHFYIAKIFQETTNLENFAIIDTNHLMKKFFSNQKFVKFKKVWYFRDEISKPLQKSDIEYLSSFEKKYGINLRLLAFSDRAFLSYNKYHKFTWEEILFILEQECKFFETILNETNPDYLAIIISDYHKHTLLSELCQAKKIKVLMLSPARFGYRTSISKDFDTIDDFEIKNSLLNKKERQPISELQNYLKKYNTYSQFSKPFLEKKEKTSKIKILQQYFHTFSILSNEEFRKYYENWGKSPLKFLTNSFPLVLYLKRWYRLKFLVNHSILKPNINQKFIYFPLHLEPERGLLVNAPFFTNQLEIIKQISKSLPIDHKLYVKEHYALKFYGWRPKSYYKTILEIPNVELINPFAKPEILLKHCSLVVAIAGTSAMEAGFYEKPSIVLSDSSYSYLPFIYRLKEIEQMPNIIRSLIETKFDYSLLSDYIKLIDNETFDFDLVGLESLIGNEFFQGLDKTIDINEKKVEKFFFNQKRYFEKLAHEYLKKIQQSDAN